MSSAAGVSFLVRVLGGPQPVLWGGSGDRWQRWGSPASPLASRQYWLGCRAHPSALRSETEAPGPPISPSCFLCLPTRSASGNPSTPRRRVLAACTRDPRTRGGQRPCKCPRGPGGQQGRKGEDSEHTASGQREGTVTCHPRLLLPQGLTLQRSPQIPFPHFVWMQ